LEILDKTYGIEEVLSNVIHEPKDSLDKLGRFVLFGEHSISMVSDRYKTFINSGTKCVSCGLEGKYFKMCRSKGSTRYHFNLYAADEAGNDVLMTKDHIVPKSKGGPNSLNNYQTMCVECNRIKADKNVRIC